MKESNNLILAPSILNSNFANLYSQIKEIEKGGAEWIHLDIMDGHFVPNISFGPLIVQTVNSITDLFLDAHLMIDNPEKFIEMFKDAGSDLITIHIEVCDNIHKSIESIKNLGISVGVSLNPDTPIEKIIDIVPYVDLVLIMTVFPGFGGQEFIPYTLDKVKKLKEIAGKNNDKLLIQVDGGITIENIRKIADAGANVFVVGSAIFHQPNIEEAVKKFRNILGI
jgi:ribulose-phosphate 3-epimerase